METPLGKITQHYYDDFDTTVKYDFNKHKDDPFLPKGNEAQLFRNDSINQYNLQYALKMVKCYMLNGLVANINRMKNKYKHDRKR